MTLEKYGVVRVYVKIVENVEMNIDTMNALLQKLYR